MLNRVQCLWLSWQSSFFRYQRPVVRIQSSEKFYNCRKDENKEAGNGLLKN